MLDDLRAVSNQCSYVLTFVSVLHRYGTLLQRYVFYGVGWVAFMVGVFCRIYGCDKLGVFDLKTANSVR